MAGSPKYRLYDMHCHLSFVKGGLEGWGGADDPRIAVFSGTVTPEEYFESISLDDPDNVRWGMGMHPRWIASGECGYESQSKFMHWLPATHFISEVGLDFGKKYEESFGTQGFYFTQFVDLCKGKLVSVHAVRSVSAMLEDMEYFNFFEDNQVIFHWFSGTSDELQRAIKDGAYFSVGPLMLNSKRGREYAKAIPLDRLLLETDYPMEQDAEYSVDQHVRDLEETLEALAELRGMDVDELGRIIADTSAALWYPSRYGKEN